MVVKIKIGREKACLDGKLVRFYRGKKFIWGLKYKNKISAEKAFKWFRTGGSKANNEIEKRIKFRESLMSNQGLRRC